MKLKRRRRNKFHREIKLNAGKESRLGSNYLIRSIEIPENYFHDVIYIHRVISRLFWNIAA